MKSVETRKIWRLHNRAFLHFYCSRNDQRHRRYLLCTFRLLGFANSSDNRVDDRARILRLWRVLLEAKLDLPFVIDRRGAQVRAAEIGSEDQSGIALLSHPALGLCVFAR